APAVPAPTTAMRCDVTWSSYRTGTAKRAGRRAWSRLGARQLAQAGRGPPRGDGLQGAGQGDRDVRVGGETVWGPKAVAAGPLIDVAVRVWFGDEPAVAVADIAGERAAAGGAGDVRGEHRSARGVGSDRTVGQRTVPARQIARGRSERAGRVELGHREE